MSDEQQPSALAARVRALAGIFAETDLIRIRIERDGEDIELGRHSARLDAPDIPSDLSAISDAPPTRLDTIKADLVGIFRLSRPMVSEGDFLEVDRELAYIEALGIRNPVRSQGTGRIVSLLCADADPVDYGRPLFEIDRG